MSYSTATWRIRIAKGSFVEISVNGCGNDLQAVTADEVIRAGFILREVGQAIRRIADRWAKVEAPAKKAELTV